MSSAYSDDRRRVIAALRVVAALSEKLAQDLEGNRLWEGDYSQTMAEIQRHMGDASTARIR